ncbi:response regulator [Herbaspirillum sp. RTI4]|uniref:HD domain-containing phosphohydrolase n=1 Tax=Herbaspirillum sp. RTI4 TaxID=3048640 RepID=UPI002AB355F7|nr:HD domain-containing phosphohydrolase [Herbaspirillum sp. RTI4]MDY7578229.1 response regulator [Herbaspirillum sp. RTI4]MEA9981567.1 response regulator [Herbaspirillum sp. RTI4]
MNILLLDDDPTNVALLAHLLDGVPNVVLTEFTDPMRALEWCRTEQPDLLLIDYMMPQMDGLQFLSLFRQLPGQATTPLIMITAAAETALRNSALQMSATDFLAKPVNRAELRARVGNMLALRKNQLELIAQAEVLAEQVKNASKEIERRDLESIRYLSLAAQCRDEETGGHLLRMATYAHLIATELGLSEEECAIVRDAAPLHDIGKVGIPDRILLKRGRLDDDEMAIMRTHPALGAAILSGGTSPLLRAAASIALSHHERYDGSGYPSGTRGEDIPLYARIISVADVFDALTTARPYKQAWELERAMLFLQEGAGSHFDPLCVEVFLKNRESVGQICQRLRDEITAVDELPH